MGYTWDGELNAWHLELPRWSTEVPFGPPKSKFKSDRPYPGLGAGILPGSGWKRTRNDIRRALDTQSTDEDIGKRKIRTPIRRTQGVAQEDIAMQDWVENDPESPESPDQPYRRTRPWTGSEEFNSYAQALVPYDPEQAIEYMSYEEHVAAINEKY
jgi:hypothetical protein